MKNEREKEIINTATKLDAITDNDGKLTKLSLEIVENNDDMATVELFKITQGLLASNNKQVYQVSTLLKNLVVNYYGYLKVKEICSNGSKEEKEENKSLDELLKELNALIGLDRVKEKVNNLIVYQKVQKLRREKGLKTEKSTLHMAFIGNPGTGKTTVARIVGRIYKQIGILSKGHFLEVSRTDLIAGYQGQTALKVKEVIERAKGGVLFIDEAYSITENDHSDSYGRECLTELTKALEDYREDLVVIVAGYTDLMKQFFESNPGLESRFNTFIEFDDYSSDEMIEILESFCRKNDYELEIALKDKIKEYFDDEIKGKEDFANGRLARNVFDDLVMNQANRICDIDNPSIDVLKKLCVEDFKKYNTRQCLQ